MSILTIPTDTFIIAGQSNNSGRGTNNQTWTPGLGFPALNFANDYTIKRLADPYDDATGQIDTVSSDSGLAAGSVWPLVATYFLANVRRRLLLVPCAKGGSAITAWQPGANHQDRTTLYGSMVYRALRAGGTLKAVLWWQGETDAINGMSQADYNGYLDTIANAVQADLGVPLMACKLQNSSGIADDPNEAAINAAIGEAWADNANVLEGPDLSDLGSDDAYHLQTDENLATAAGRWWTAIAAAFYS